MIYSMTAFASQNVQTPLGFGQWEIRSVNHRYLDLSFKLPDSMRNLEYRLREIAQALLHRGKMDVFFKFEWNPDLKTILTIDFSLIDKLMAVNEQIQTRLPTVSPISSFDILRWPSVVQTSDRDISEIVELLENSFRSSLEMLKETRAREGMGLKGYLQERLQKMQKLTSEIQRQVPVLQKNYKAKLQEKLKNIPLEMEVGRFEQEMVYLTQKMDISEELDRLSLHIQEVDRVLKEGGIVGRRLDFLMQELNREVNTLSSKSIEGPLIQMAVDLKVLVAEMREQVQNLE